MPDPTPEEIERVARAMFDDDERDRHATSKIAPMVWPAIGAIYQDCWKSRARAAIVAYEAALVEAGMVRVPREPTGQMIDAVVEQQLVDPTEIWPAMVDAWEKSR
jgi:RNase P/RNase MRP subunit POP5